MAAEEPASEEIDINTYNAVELPEKNKSLIFSLLKQFKPGAVRVAKRFAAARACSRLLCREIGNQASHAALVCA